MKAKLVTITLSTRVLVNDNATEDEILDAAYPRLKDKLETDYFENVEPSVDDMESPFDPDFDIQSANFHNPLFREFVEENRGKTFAFVSVIDWDDNNENTKTEVIVHRNETDFMSDFNCYYSDKSEAYQDIESAEACGVFFTTKID